ncbi:A1AG1 protein, partial [Serilophus lunatus]|nr:A1AG1 protein [Serilophus lunatus]
LTLLLGLPLALTTSPPRCTPLIPITFDNTTIPRLLGQWFYIVSASRYLPHVEEMKGIKYAAFSFSLGDHEDELNVTEVLRLNETCVVKENGKIQVFHQNSTMVYDNGNQAPSMANVIPSDNDLLILNHINISSPSLSLSARTPNVSKEQMEEFRAHMHCLGFTKEEMFYSS